MRRKIEIFRFVSIELTELRVADGSVSTFNDKIRTVQIPVSTFVEAFKLSDGAMIYYTLKTCTVFE